MAHWEPARTTDGVRANAWYGEICWMQVFAAVAGHVVAVPVFDAAASPDGVVAITRYAYAVAGASEPSVYVVASGPTSVIGVHVAPKSVERSMRNAVSLRCGSV